MGPFLSTLGSFGQNLVNALGGSPQQPTTVPQGRVIGDPSQMKLIMVPQVQAAAPPSTTPTTSPSTAPAAPAAPAASNSPFSQELIRQGILNWSHGQTNVPILNTLPSLYQSGQQLQAAHLDPYSPTVMALRETQGGRDLSNPKYQGQIGDHDLYNIRNVGGQPGNTKPFVDYPDLNTAIVGGGPNNQSGYTGMILHPQPGQGDPYAAYRQSGNISDLLSRYSPPGDGNGTLDQQVQNYQYIRKFFGGGQ